MFCRSLFVLFLLAIVFSVLRLTDSDYPDGIFKLLVSKVVWSMQFIFTYEEEANYYFTQRLIQTYRNKVLKRGVGERTN